MTDQAKKKKPSKSLFLNFYFESNCYFSYKKAFYGPVVTKDDHDAHEKATNRLKKYGYDEKKLLARE